MCFWHISTCWWCPVLPFRSSGSHLREAWCHSFYFFYAPHLLLFYIPINDFTKSKWIFTTFFTYSIYPSSHCTQIHHLSIHSCHSKWPVVWHRVGHPWCHDSLSQPFLLFWRYTFYFSHLQDSGGCWSRVRSFFGASHSLIDAISWVKHYIYVYGCGPSPDPLTNTTRYFKGERESWFSSFEKFVLVRNGFVWSHHLLLIFIFKWGKLK